MVHIYMKPAIVGLMLLHLALSCSPPVGYKRMCDQQRFGEAKNIVYGKFVREIPYNANKTSKDMDRFDYDFQVYCVIKSTEGPINETVTIDYVYPPMCTMESKKLTKVGQEAIVLLQASEGRYRLHQVNIGRAVYEGTAEMKNWVVSSLKAKLALPSGCCKENRPSNVNCTSTSTSNTPMVISTPDGIMPCGAMTTLSGHVTVILVLVSILLSRMHF